MDRVVITAVGIVAAVGLSALVFVGANKLFDLTETRFKDFNGAVGGIAAFTVFGLLWANRIIVSPVVVTIIATVLGVAIGYGLGVFEKGTPRLVVGLAGGLALGLLLGFTVRSFFWPSIDPMAAIVGLAVGGALGWLNWLAVKSRYNLRPLLFLWLGIGWLFGAWLPTDFDVTLSNGTLSGGTVGTQAEAIIVAALLGLLVGAWIGSVPYPDKITRAEISQGSRKFIFVTPALAFIIATLLIPLGRTIWLGFLTGSPTNLEFTGLTNYSDIFQDPGIINFANWTDIFSSSLFWAGVALVVGGLALGAWIGRSGGTGLGTGFSFSAGTLSLLAGGAALLGFAVFVAVRGTISNNLWWIFSVIIFAVGLGLAVAVLADRSKGENVAKSLIFLPMAISFVGASVIWRLMYIARPPGDQQTGVFNTLWVQIGEWSNSTAASTVISVILLSLIHI